MSERTFYGKRADGSRYQGNKSLMPIDWRHTQKKKYTASFILVLQNMLKLMEE